MTERSERSPPDDEAARERWRGWKEATFGSEYMIWHDGLDVGAVTRLTGAARAEALGLLALGIELGDAHAAEALAALGDAASVPALRALLPTLYGASRVKVAVALHRLAPDESLAVELIGVMHSPIFWGDRLEAARDLRLFTCPEAEAALLSTVAHDPEYLVRYHASDSLLVRYGVTPADIAQHKALFADICGPRGDAPNTDEDFARFARARDALRAFKPS